MTRQELTERQKKIVNWVLDNTKKTENEIATAMKEAGVCSRITTLHEIEELEKRQILEDIRAKTNNQSCIVVRDENEYTRIYQVITKIKDVIDIMDEPIKNFFFQSAELPASPSESDRQQFRMLIMNLESNYRQNYGLMLQSLWERTNDTIESEKDKQVLHTRIVGLMLKMNKQLRGGRSLNQIFKLYTFNKEVIKFRISNKIGITKELIDKLNVTQGDFLKVFPNE